MCGIVAYTGHKACTRILLEGNPDVFVDFTKNNAFTIKTKKYKWPILKTDDGREIDAISIYNLSGQQILKARPANGIVDISHLHPGMYIVEVVVENTRIRQKLLVQR